MSYDRIDLAILAELQADAGIQNQVLASDIVLSTAKFTTELPLSLGTAASADPSGEAA